MTDDAANFLRAFNRRITRLAGAAMVLVVAGLILFKVGGKGSASLVAVGLWLLGLLCAATSAYGRSILHKGVVLGSGDGRQLEVYGSPATGPTAWSGAGRATVYEVGSTGNMPVADVRCHWLVLGTGAQLNGMAEVYGPLQPGQTVMAVNATGGLIGQVRSAERQGAL